VQLYYVWEVRLKTGRDALAILMGLAVCLAGAMFALNQRHDSNARHTVVRRAVAESIGMNSLAVSSEGASSRMPMEGPAGCLGDVPGGYCFRTACDIVTSPGSGGQPMSFEVVKATQ
jgi:hypothetical protein